MTNLRWMYPIISVSSHEYLNSSAFAGASIYLYFILRRCRKIWHRSFNKYSKILPKSREERIRSKPICVINTWDADIVDEIKPSPMDHIVIKRRDSAFQDTEIGVWLKSIGIDTLAFCGIDTSICVEASLRDAFNNGYDVVLISDATASGNAKHFETTLEVVRDYYGLVMNVEEFARHLPQRAEQHNR